MADIRTNIFGIGEVYELQKEGQWVERNRESYREFGYFAGGNDGVVGSSYSGVNRIDFSNDTATSNSRAILAIEGRYLSGVNNKNYGYMSGESNLGLFNKFNFANETSTSIGYLVPGTNIGYTGNLSNPNFGYFCGGDYTVPGATSTVRRINFSNDTALLSNRGNQTQNRNLCAGAGNSNFGYLNGSRNNPQSSVDRIDYSNDSVLCRVRGPMSFGTEHRGNKAGNSNFGWFTNSYSATYVQRISYANDLVSASVRGNTNSTYSANDIGNGNFSICYRSGSSPLEKVDYSNDTVLASTRGNLHPQRFGEASMCASSFGGSPVSYLGAPWTATAPFGYFGGGRNTQLSIVDRIDYTNDTTTASVRGPLTLARYGLAATGNSNFGYFGGGFNSPPLESTVDRIDYSNDLSSALLKGPLTIARHRISATGNSNFGYFIGGGTVNGSQRSTVDRVNYVNDSVVTSSRGPLSAIKTAGSATGNSNFGYYTGGVGAPGNIALTITDRMDYSNDTSTSSSRGPLNAARTYMSASGAQNFGYVFGGRDGANNKLSSIERINYTNDTSTAAFRGNLATADMFRTGATSSSNFGYIGGYGDPGQFSTVNRLDYTNDTQTASVRGPLSSARYETAASSSQAYGGAPNTTVDPLPSYIRAATKWIDSNTLDLPFKRVLGSYGYFYGGITYSNIHRIDFSNDTTLVTRPILTANLSTQEFMCGFGNNNYGYAAGGGAFSYPSTSLIQRIDYSNDSSSSSIRGSLSVSRGAISGSFSNNNYGYVGGGFQTGVGFKSTVDRLDFSNDLNTAITKGSLSLARSSMSGMVFGNTFGYFGSGGSGATASGYFEGDTTIINRVSFSNDIITTPLRGKMTVQRGRYATSYNSNYGWSAGGRVPGAPNGVIVTSVERIDFSNDLITNSTRGSLNVVKNYFAGTGNETYGWFSMGEGSSKIERINYSNDLVAASIRQTNAPYVSLSIGTTNARSS